MDLPSALPVPPQPSQSVLDPSEGTSDPVGVRTPAPERSPRTGAPSPLRRDRGRRSSRRAPSPPVHQLPLERHSVSPLHEVRYRLAELVPAHRVHAALDVDVVAYLPAHELRLAQITTNTNPTTAPATTPRMVATRESKNATVSRPPKAE